MASVVTLAKTPTLSIGPDAGPACQPTIGMPAALACFHRRRLLDGVEAADDDAVRLQRHGLAEGGGAAADRAGAVDHLTVPADRAWPLPRRRWRRRGCRRSCMSPAKNDDLLARLRLRAGGRAVPGCRPWLAYFSTTALASAIASADAGCRASDGERCDAGACRECSALHVHSSVCSL